MMNNEDLFQKIRKYKRQAASCAISQNNNLHLMDFDLSFNIGKYHFETSDFEKAKEEWDLLIRQQGLRYFEDEDPKYLDFYKNPEKFIK